MKRLLLIFAVGAIVSSCNNSDTKTTATGGDTTKTTNAALADAKASLPEMPYKLDSAYKNWQTGDPQHAVTVMKGLQAYENGDIAACMNAFGDSVWVGFDYFHKTMSKDSLKAFFTQGRAMYSSMKVKMEDWESVISADKKSEWVTLWYKEYTTDKKGVTDSLDVINDAKMVNGKIVVLDEKTQHLGPPPAKK